MSTRNILKSSVENASFNIVFQILFRCITFILNAFIIRHVGQDVLGIMNVRLLLLESTILFVSREPLLKACLTDAKSHNWAQVINLIWLSVPFSCLFGILMVFLWTNVLSSTEDVYLEQYHMGCYAIAVSCIINQVTQAFILVAQSYCFVKLKVAFETVYIIIRTATFVVLVLNHKSYAINAFSIAQVSSAVLLLFMYVTFFYWYINNLNKLKQRQLNGDSEEKRLASLVLKQSPLFKDMSDFKLTSVLNFLPGNMENKESKLNKNLVYLTTSFLTQSAVKQILTEGERYVMTISPVMDFSQQSVYDIVNNLGSLAARFIFRPIEESGYFYFTQMIKRQEPLAKQNQNMVKESSIVLSQLCKVVTSIGLIAVVFGQSYSSTLLYLYGGQAFLTTEDNLPTLLLRWHCIAVLLLAINGVTECYVFATMDNKQLDRYNFIMVIFSVSFLSISYILTNIFGPVGFILANCVNMLARISHSIYFINKQYESTKYKPLDGLRPEKLFLIALCLSGIVTKLSEVYVLKSSLLLHIFIGAVCFVVTGVIWAVKNKDLLRIGYDKYKRRVSLKMD